MQDILNRTLEECYPSNDEKQNLRGKAFEIMLELKDRPENAFVNRKEARKMLQIVDQGVFPEGRDNAKSLGR
jgi:hypothetical protein